jgi:hypothetical protein
MPIGAFVIAEHTFTVVAVARLTKWYCLADRSAAAVRVPIEMLGDS